MHTRRRFWLVLILLFVMLSMGLGVWAWRSVLSSRQIVNRHTINQTHNNAKPTDKDNSLNMALGGHLIIPSIGVNAPVETVGEDKDGHLATPKKNEWDGVGWYQEGPDPGHTGSAVMDGHLDRPGGSPAVFWKLGKLHKGDLVSVQDKHGRTLHFKVSKVAYYAPDKAPINQIFGNSNGTFLNLITCAGDWLPDQDQYSQRLVVYTQVAA